MPPSAHRHLSGEGRNLRSEGASDLRLGAPPSRGSPHPPPTPSGQRIVLAGVSPPRSAAMGGYTYHAMGLNSHPMVGVSVHAASGVSTHRYPSPPASYGRYSGLYGGYSGGGGASVRGGSAEYRDASSYIR
eukprot:1112880-Prorocentrum_minimum.AAC.1